jgi:hypothetical protein
MQVDVSEVGAKTGLVRNHHQHLENLHAVKKHEVET